MPKGVLAQAARPGFPFKRGSGGNPFPNKGPARRHSVYIVWLHLT